ncbi:hypothetical protein [Candidatus Borrarchaeum sp.]|uniref:hypothetical protein n=1 Tax=Candidatus Borrarchaeum sp. TaxID=2846742 RepID=UPI00257F327B|nr:hypothetical protein [Candidatus Borrarchaeum sp.]
MIRLTQLMFPKQKNSRDSELKCFTMATHASFTDRSDALPDQMGSLLYAGR